MCNDNQRCAGQVAYMQDVSKAVELRRRIAHYREAYNRFPSERGAMQNMALGMVEVWLNELAPDTSQCDNPPVEPAKGE